MSTTTTPTLGREKPSKIECAKFYAQYKGHPLDDLETFLRITRQERPDKPIVYFAGDSSLDNKFWVKADHRDPNSAVPLIYEKTLDVPDPRPDVAFWLNHALGDRATVINTAVEESMIRERDKRLLPHDQFICDNIRPEDALIISVGGNDVAFKPTLCTIWNMLQLAWFTSRESLEDGSARPLRYFEVLFGAKVHDYILKMTAKTKPRAVFVCMIYYPLESGLGQKSWADYQLTALGYDKWPGKLQAAIRAMYRQATMQINVDGINIIPCALYELLDGKAAKDYTERVEPSEEGGKKMAERFAQLLGEFMSHAVDSKQG